MKKLDLNIFIYEYTWAELDKIDINLLTQARQACTTAYAPYSNFHVGAALLLDNGNIILGSNQENAAYPSGLCAERTAIFAAGANFPNQIIRSIAIAACKHNDSCYQTISPCGACRQAMLEYENKQKEPIRFLMQGEGEKIYISPSIGNLLPIQFSVNQL